MEENIDGITRLAMNIYSNKGVYVPLLGSGVSLSAGIMSGWKVTEDLLKQLCFMQEGTVHADVFQWYKDKFHKEAEYSDLLSQLGHHSAEIGNLLWQYFEQTEEDKDKHLKEPTEAHRAIAELASKGYFKVIITTNFDRLLEAALEQKGVKYQVVSDESQLSGSVPIVHFPLTIVKINGDYKDARVRNTEEELTCYPKAWDDYLREVLKNFGLITVGWSATWDKAVIKDLKECCDHKYSYCFTYIDEAKSKEIIDLSKASNGDAVRIDGANEFFTEMSEKINALELIHGKEMEIDKEIAVTRVKEYIKHDTDIIRYTDLFENETARVIQKASEYTYTLEGMSAQLYEHIYSTAYANLSVLLPMGIVAVRWADASHYDAIVDSLSAIANRKLVITGSWSDEPWLQNHATDTIYLYGLGVACVFYRNYALLDCLLKVKFNKLGHLASDYLIDIANCWIIDKSTWNRTASRQLKTPFSSFVSNLLKPAFPFIEGKDDFDAYFGIFEKLLSMYFYRFISSRNSIEQMRQNAPIGQFAWQSFYLERQSNNIYGNFFKEVDAEQNNSIQLKQGLFDGKYDIYADALANVNEIEKRARAYML